MLISRVVIAGLVGVAASFGVLALVRLTRSLNPSRVPTNEKLLRPPGESLSRKIASYDERLLASSILLMTAPVFYALQTPKISNVVFFGCLIPLTLLCAIPLFIAGRNIRNYALGYLGERAVGEELNQLLRDGCHVFHDYPGGPNWNIDHIVVAPSGVYAIETKTRRKRRTRTGQRDYELIFDGKNLRFPHCTDTFGLEQARRNAADLSVQLTKSTGETVKAKPILTFPGWLVTLKGKGDVHVLNPKQIRQVVLNNNGPTLSPAQIQRIIHQLDQKCRDVEL
jgi:hypothetical protein